MAARLRSAWLVILMAAAGCLPTKNEPLQTVKPGDLVRAPRGFRNPQRQVSPPTAEQKRRVDAVGEKLIAANRLTGLRPSVLLVGVPAVEVFHNGTDVLFVTEGLSKKCTTEGQLAAALAYEMGRMVAEREVLAAPEARQPERMPPQESRIGTDSGGPFGPADGTRLAELARFEKERPKRGKAPLRTPDPLVLAKHYLETAGYSAKDLDDIAPLLREARSQDGLERQLVGGQFDRPWTP